MLFNDDKGDLSLLYALCNIIMRSPWLQTKSSGFIFFVTHYVTQSYLYEGQPIRRNCQLFLCWCRLSPALNSAFLDVV